MASSPKSKYLDDLQKSASAEAGSAVGEETSEASEEKLFGTDPENAEDDGEEDLYIIDEEELKNLEKSMTDDEKKANKERALNLKGDGNVSFKAGQGATWARLEKNKLAIKDCTKAIELNPSYLKPVLKRAWLYKETKNLDEALKDYQRVLELDPSNGEARHACMTLPDEIKERNEKLQAEMIDKLKELGNLVLRPFGMSTDNFKLTKDGEGGRVQNTVSEVNVL
ncbi:hypothetical protein MTO96_010363 [Rhipicephalus appendiculatus]